MPDRQLRLVCANYATHKHPSATLAGATPALSSALHAYQRVVAQDGGTLFSRPDAESAPARCVTPSSPCAARPDFDPPRYRTV